MIVFLLVLAVLTVATLLAIASSTARVEANHTVELMERQVARTQRLEGAKLEMNQALREFDRKLDGLDDF